jgi:hypothetical protein
MIRSPRPISLPDFSSFHYLHPFDGYRDDDKERLSAMGQADQRRNPQDSPIGQLLKHLGMTREDLERHSSHMREFLTTESTPSPLPEDNAEPAKPGVDGQPLRQPRSRASSHGNASGIPQTPVKLRHNAGLHKPDTMEAIIERQNKLARKEKRGRRDSNAMGPPSPTPQPATLPSGPSASTSRDAKRESLSQESETQVGSFSCYKRYVPLTRTYLKQPLVYFHGSHQSSRLKFKVTMPIKSPGFRYSTIPRHPIVLHLLFHLLRHLLLPRRGVHPLSSTWSRPLGHHRTMMMKSRMTFHPVLIQQRSRTSRMPL